MLGVVAVYAAQVMLTKTGEGGFLASTPNYMATIGATVTCTRWSAVEPNFYRTVTTAWSAPGISA
jgi:hypothetical protein